MLPGASLLRWRLLGNSAVSSSYMVRIIVESEQQQRDLS